MPRIRMLRTIANSKRGTERQVSESIARLLVARGVAEYTAAPLDMSPAAIRSWALENDIEVSAKGFIKKSVIEAYKNAH